MSLFKKFFFRKINGKWICGRAVLLPPLTLFYKVSVGRTEIKLLEPGRHLARFSFGHQKQWVHQDSRRKLEREL